MTNQMYCNKNSKSPHEFPKSSSSSGYNYTVAPGGLNHLVSWYYE